MTSISSKMEDNLTFLKTEDDPNFLKMEDDLNVFENERQPKFVYLNCFKWKKKKKMVVAPLVLIMVLTIQFFWEHNQNEEISYEKDNTLIIYFSFVFL